MDSKVTLDIGSGGKKTSALISGMILPLLSNEYLDELGDGAVIPGAEQIVTSTDSFVVSPYVFPGGDIGKLSVCGTVNDVSMAGGEPLYLTLSLILEEGFPMEELSRILNSVRETAEKAGVRVVTGDTKVVERGKGDGIYINTTGIGALRTAGLSPKKIRPGDAVLVSGPVGNHGMAVMLARNPGMMEADFISDCAPLHRPALALGALGSGLRCLRDPTRGGLATTLNEFIEDGHAGIEIREADVPVETAVRMAAELLGLDPFYSACEGRMIAVTAPECAEQALDILRSYPETAEAAMIGTVTETHPGKLVVITPYGGQRVAAKLAGAQLPRIC